MLTLSNIRASDVLGEGDMEYDNDVAQLLGAEEVVVGGLIAGNDSGTEIYFECAGRLKWY